MNSDAERISLVVFLGNVGKKYERTRHNVAWLFARSLKIFPTLSFRRGFSGEWAQAPCPQDESLSSRRVYFLFPQTYMNLSGESAAALASFYKIPTEEILVVHDDIELGLGTISFKKGGGLGGHNGLRSLKACLGSADFWRVRIGVGKPDYPDIASYVLSPFEEKEMEALSAIFAEAEKLLLLALEGTSSSLLKEWAKRKIL